MQSWIVEYWPWSYLLAGLILAWGLSLPLFGGLFHRSRRESFSMPAMRRQSAYLRIDYQIPAGSGNSLQEIVQNTPDGRSIYLRTEFFLRYISEFRPEDVLKEWFKAGKWEADRRRRAQQKIEEQKKAFAAIRRGDLSQIYLNKRAPKEKPLALSFPLLPAQFTLFAAQGFSFVHKRQSGAIPKGFYRCRVVEWRHDDSYAEDIELVNLKDESWRIDQSALLDALRLRKAAVETVCFLNLPIFVFTGPHSKPPRWRAEQTVSGRLPIRPGTPHEFAALDARLLKLFGGINPLNLVRLSWFYHPNYGVKPDSAKYKRLMARADGKNDGPVRNSFS